ncbi:MAG: urease accessory protein, partial [Actinomycetota bacterium]|nr:urease accessory protein [Actinomycetota bacterium]
RLRVSASVGAGGSLVWHPEPGVAAAGCDHHSEAVVSLESGASLVWREEVVLGRHGEDGGRWTSSLSVDLAGTPLLRHRVELGAGTDWHSPAVGGGARCHGSVLVVGDRRLASVGPAVCMPLALGPATLVLTTGEAANDVTRALDAASLCAAP